MYLLFDIGGTNMRLAVSSNKKTLTKIKIVPTPQNFKEGMDAFEKIALELTRGKKVKAVVGGIVGPLNKEKTMVVNAPNLQPWKNKPLVKTLEKTFSAPVYLENDADLAGLGEANFGAGKGKKIVVYLTISTGVGGGRIVNGKIDHNSLGFEPGHQIICKKSLESYISGSSLGKRYKKLPSDIKDKRVWKEAAQWLAYGLHNTIVHWSPDIVILGGSMITNKQGISVKLTQSYLKKISRIFPKLPPIKKAALGDKVGLYGALAKLNQL